ncbi:MAG: hypothetical protein GQ529_11180 [Methyloprofundus sp.]|nr:hypothetical protein [Methyloprofundus sp.]
MSDSMFYLIYSPCVEKELDRVLQHKLITESGIQLRKIRLADLNALHVAKTISHAQESDFKDLFLALKENAKTTSTYILLMVLSTLLATLGLL